MTLSDPQTGHRARLRERFLAAPGALTEAELLELLLTYAIPRQDTAPLAAELLARFGSLERALLAPLPQLTAIPGLGETSAILLKAMARIHAVLGAAKPRPASEEQPALFDLPRDPGPLFAEPETPAAPEMRTYANDEAENMLFYIPMASDFTALEDFRAFLRNNLPYNAESTRRRRANQIVQRCFPTGNLSTPLRYYANHCSREDLKAALFYHTLKSEPLAAKIAEDLIWPALPRGYVEREEMRAVMLRYLPDLSLASQANALLAVFKTYTVFSVGTSDDTTLHFHTRTSTLPAFLYVLTAEFPQPGTYTFAELEQGPLRRWLLWEREWLRRQLYNLRDVGIVSKVSEIDALRQFTLAYAAPDALRYYFERVDAAALTLRERADPAGAGGAV